METKIEYLILKLKMFAMDGQNRAMKERLDFPTRKGGFAVACQKSRKEGEIDAYGKVLDMLDIIEKEVASGKD